MTQRLLVTGGAGYVGSHVVAALLDRGDTVSVLDNIRTGHRAAVPPQASFVQADLADPAAVDAVLADGPWDAVLHFAALSQVGESMRMPMRYLLDNAANGIRLIDACVRHAVPKFVLSSTAALFNVTDDAPIPEDAPIDPQSAYGDSKWMIERALRWAGQVHGLRYACLRYFNAAGADPAGRLGEDHRPESHLIPLVIDAALGRRAALEVFGDDYPTPDGTCIRDYVHVADLASAHLLAVARLDQGSVVWNLGNGAGHSVLQVIAAVERGDAAVLVASSQRAQAAGWQPLLGDLDAIVRTAFDWRLAHPDGYGD
jgi:UDP-glucose 4-epimerase